MSDRWCAVCRLDDILPDTGVCAQVDGRQVALFRVESAVYALDNFDPVGRANVLSRGIVGDLAGELVVASPLYKQHFSLTTGRCLEEPQHCVATYATRVTEGVVWVAAPAPAGGAAEGDSHGRLRLVVVGNGMAGMRAVEELLKVAPDRYDIEVFGAEPHGNYNRIMLSPVLCGEKQFADIMLHPLEWYAEHGVTLHRGDPVAALDRARRRVTSRSGVSVSYDRLLLATGSTPAVPAVPGADLPGVVTFRDLQDVDTMVAASATHRHAVVIGGGLLGLEAANGLRCRGMEVTVVHLHAALMERQLDPTAAALLRESLEQRGIRFHMPARTHHFVGESRVSAVCFEDGSELRADLVVVAIGIRPNIALAAAADLRCERGVLVNDTMATSDPAVYAVGECIQHRDRTYGLVAPLWEQARVCAAHLAVALPATATPAAVDRARVGQPLYQGSALAATQLKVTGIHLFSAGDIRQRPRGESLVFKDARRGVYKRVIIEDDVVRGAVLFGDTKDGSWYLNMMTEGRRVGGLRNTLVFGEAYSAGA